MAHEFLSDEWFEAATAIYAEHGRGVKPPFAIKMQQVVTDVPWGGEVRSFVDTSGDEPRMGKGEISAPDVTLTTDYATARKLFVDQDQQAAMQAFMSGKIKVAGDMSKLMLMQAAPPVAAMQEIATKVKEMTA
jgi:hypothetical protein